MQRSSIAQSVYKLAIAGEQVGFSVEGMIQMLNAGITMETLLDLYRVAATRSGSRRPFLTLDHVAATSIAFTPLRSPRSHSIEQSTFSAEWSYTLPP